MESYYPPIEKFKGYRYLPFKDDVTHYLDFICVRFAPTDENENENENENGYTIMVIEDNLIDYPEHPTAPKGDAPWNYGDIHYVDWHIDLKLIKLTPYDLQLAKLQTL